jgi:hypothetical protein
LYNLIFKLIKQESKRRMLSSGMLCHVAVVRTDVHIEVFSLEWRDWDMLLFPPSIC